MAGTAGPRAPPPAAGRGYGLPPDRRAGLAGLAAARIRFTLDLVRRRAAEGEPGFVRLVESGVADGIERDARWTEAHRDELTAALLSGSPLSGSALAEEAPEPADLSA